MSFLIGLLEKELSYNKRDWKSLLTGIGKNGIKELFWNGTKQTSCFVPFEWRLQINGIERLLNFNYFLCHKILIIITKIRKLQEWRVSD